MGGVADYDFTLPFVDVMRQARPWGSAAAPWDGNCSTGPDGWPSQGDFGTVFVTFPGNVDAPHPTVEGRWLLAFTGQATLALGSGFHPTVEDEAYDPASDTTTLTLVLAPQTAADCNCIMFGFANASTRAGGAGLKGIRLLQPGYSLDQAAGFSTPLLSLLGRFDVLRFMDWAATNGNQHVAWAERTLPAACTYARGGVPWESIVALGAAAPKDIWVNIPAHASDDYVLQMATLLFEAQFPHNIYVEYSNEVCECLWLCWPPL